MRPHEAEMIKKGEEAKVDAKDKEAFEEVQKIVESQEQKIKEETEGSTPLSAVSSRYQYLTSLPRFGVCPRELLMSYCLS